jgi:AraC-like DNA-binding protein
MRRLRLSSDDFPEDRRLSLWREIYGRTFFNNDVEPIGDTPFYARAVLTSLTEVGISTSWRSPAHNHVTREHAKRGKEVAYLIILKRGTAVMTQLDRMHEVDIGGAVVVMPDHPPWTGSLLAEGGNVTVALALPLPVLGALAPRLTSQPGVVVPSANPALRLLRRYLDLIEADDAVEDGAMARSVSTHIIDLATLALGARGDAADMAIQRGAKAARLAAIRSDIVARLDDGDLSADKLAATHGISPRYVRKLFEEQGLSFSSFVLGERLAKARRMLADPRHAHLTIAQIALEAGFGDISYFNRAFRRQFGATPSDIRAVIR